MVEVVDLVVAGGDRASRGLIDVDERPQDAADEDGGQARPSPAGRRSALSGGSGASLRTCLATDAGVVAHPLELVAHVVEREQEAQVARDRLLRRDRRA